MKKTFFLAAASLMVALLTACSGSDDATSEVINPQQPQSPTAGKVILKGTLTNDETRSTVTNEGVATWSTGDKIAVRYQTANGYAMAEATVEAGGSANATFTATLDNPKGGAVQLIYPASLYQETAPYYNTEKLLTDQKGTLEDVGANWNIQTAEATMTISGSTASLAADVDMQSQVSLVIFNLKTDEGKRLTTKTLKITAGSDIYIVTSSVATNSLAVAMKPVSGDFSFEAKTEGIVYTLEPSLSLSNVTSSHVGYVFDKDGNIYSCSPGIRTYTKSVSGTTLSAGQYYTSLLELSYIHPVAMIAYVGEPGTADASSTTYRGLAMAMDHIYGNNWGGLHSASVCSYRSENIADHRDKKDMNGIANTAKLATGTCGHDDHGIAKLAYGFSVKDFTPGNINCSNWFLASTGQWLLFFEACGVDTSVCNSWTYNFGGIDAITKIQNTYKNAGIDSFSVYWTSSESTEDFAVAVSFSSQSGAEGLHLGEWYKASGLALRPFLAF